jgi:hypothetical protein
MFRKTDFQGLEKVDAVSSPRFQALEKVDHESREWTRMGKSRASVLQDESSG